MFVLNCKFQFPPRELNVRLDFRARKNIKTIPNPYRKLIEILGGGVEARPFRRELNIGWSITGPGYHGSIIPGDCIGWR